MENQTSLEAYNNGADYSILLKLTLLFGSSLTVMAGAIVAPSLPQMNLAFHYMDHSELLVKMIMTVPALFIAISAPLSGWLLDNWGRKPVLIVAFVLYAISGTAGYFLDSLYEILISRAFLGIAVGGILSGIVTLIGDYFSGKKLNSFMGLQGAFASFGAAFFLIIGGSLANIGWHYPFLMYIFSLIILPGVIFALREPEKNNGTPMVKVAGRRNHLPWKKLSGIYLIAFLSMIVFYMIPVQVPFYLRTIGVTDNVKIGISIAAMASMGGIAGTQFRRVRSWLSYMHVFAVIFTMIGISYILINLIGRYEAVVAAMAVAGLGVGMLVPNLNVRAVSLVSFDVRGRAVAGTTSALLMGQFVSPIAVKPLIETLDYAYTFGIIGIIMLAAAAAFALNKTPDI